MCEASPLGYAVGGIYKWGGFRMYMAKHYAYARMERNSVKP